jgi:alpha-L-fucosidase 2
MNYWGVEKTAFLKHHDPLFDLFRQCSVMGHTVAHEIYHRPGWVMHHNTTIWRDAQPVDRQSP